MALERLITFSIIASSSTCINGLRDRGAAFKTSEAANASSLVIPAWKVDLVTGNDTSWWSRFGPASLTDMITSAIWGEGLPQVTSTPAQDSQRCPIVDLPADFLVTAKQRSWAGLYGEWNTVSGVKLATWEQNYLGMGFSRDIKHVGVHIRSAASGQVAIRTRHFTDAEMFQLFGWKEATASPPKSGANATDTTAATSTEEAFNLAIFDCMGTLMFVVKHTAETNPSIRVYSRDAKLVVQSFVGSPVLRYQFSDPKSGYLITTAEAPGINASINEKDIPRDVEVGDVLPFGLHFQTGGYANSSLLMEIEFRWVLAAVVQALAVHNAQLGPTPEGIFFVVEASWVICISAVTLAVTYLIYGTYRCVYPSWERLADNRFLVGHADAVKSNPYAEQMGLYSKAPGYGANS